MKVFLFALLVCASLAKTVDRHYHYHLEGLNAEAQRELLALNPKHKGFLSNLWCFVKNPINKESRGNCISAANAKAEEKKNSAAADKSQAQKRLLSSESDLMVKNLHHKLTKLQVKCNTFYFWSKARRVKCLNGIKRKLFAQVVSVGGSAHKNFFKKFLCMIRNPINKTKREECYRKIQNKNNDNSNVNATSKVAGKRRLSAAHKHVGDSLSCFFKNMTNSKKRAECNAAAKAKRDARNKAKAAKQKAAKEDKKKNQSKPPKAGLNAKGKASHRSNIRAESSY